MRGSSCLRPRLLMLGSASASMAAAGRGGGWRMVCPGGCAAHPPCGARHPAASVLLHAAVQATGVFAKTAACCCISSLGFAEQLCPLLTIHDHDALHHGGCAVGWLRLRCGVRASVVARGAGSTAYRVCAVRSYVGVPKVLPEPGSLECAGLCSTDRADWVLRGVLGARLA